MLNLDLKENEKEVLEYWKNKDINKQVNQKKGNKKFYFLDGPPYVTGDLHPGQMWVKTIKDIFLRYKRYRGFNVVNRAGYDVHGLPIENKIEKLLNLKTKLDIENQIGVENFVHKCRDYVDSYMGRMNNDFLRFGISLDFSNPYIPYKSEYINASWKIFKSIYQNNYVYNDNKIAAYCPHCQTPLSQGTTEIEYKDVSDPSILVAFKIDKTKKSKLNIDLNNTYLLVWTTTPWTIPSNIAIAVNPKELYVDSTILGKHYIIAKKRIDIVANLIGESVIVNAEFYGSELSGVYYVSPIEEKIEWQKELRESHKVVLDNKIVTMEEGTGLVHIAPSHGIEDFAVGKKNNLPILSILGEDARYTDKAGAYKSLSVPDEANNVIIKDLEDAGALIYHGKIIHSYPHCWRCESKLIFTLTKQWFFNIQKIKKKLIKQNKKVHWHPKEALLWQEDILKNSPDWCISRQRYWGIPIPIWVCGSCGKKKVIGSFEELAENAADTEKMKNLKDLHRPYIDEILIKCECGGDMSRILDVFDVWYDSSIAFRASLSDEEFGTLFPVDYILEGRDQLRGWFSAQMKIGLLAYNKIPFKHVGIDGMMLASDGRQMHKHLNNYVPINDIITRYSADGFRLWCSSHTPWLDLQFNEDEIKNSEKNIMTLYNIFNLFSEYSNAINYNAGVKIKKPSKKLDTQELWLVSRVETLKIAVTKALDDYRAFDAINELILFFVEDFSRFYLKSAKQRILYGSKKEAKNVMDTMLYAMNNLLIMLSPFMPFSTEKIYLGLFKMKESIFLEDWPKPNSKFINPELENDFDITKKTITALLNSREKAKIGLKYPVESATIETESDTVYNSIGKLQGIIKDYVNVNNIIIKKINGIKKEVTPLFNKIGPEFKDKAPMVAEELKKVDGNEITKNIGQSGYYSLHTELGTFQIKPEHFIITEKIQNTDAVSFKYGIASVDTTLSEELKEKYVIRDLIRKIQMTRKELNLKLSNKINLYINGIEGLGFIIDKNKDYIKKIVKAKRIEINVKENLDWKDMEVSGINIKVAIKVSD